MSLVGLEHQVFSKHPVAFQASRISQKLKKRNLYYFSGLQYTKNRRQSEPNLFRNKHLISRKPKLKWYKMKIIEERRRNSTANNKPKFNPSNFLITYNKSRRKKKKKIQSSKQRIRNTKIKVISSKKDSFVSNTTIPNHNFEIDAQKIEKTPTTFHFPLRFRFSNDFLKLNPILDNHSFIFKHFLMELNVAFSDFDQKKWMKQMKWKDQEKKIQGNTSEEGRFMHESDAFEYIKRLDLQNLRTVYSEMKFGGTIAKDDLKKESRKHLEEVTERKKKYQSQLNDLKIIGNVLKKKNELKKLIYNQLKISIVYENQLKFIKSISVLKKVLFLIKSSSTDPKETKDWVKIISNFISVNYIYLVIIQRNKIQRFEGTGKKSVVERNLELEKATSLEYAKLKQYYNNAIHYLTLQYNSSGTDEFSRSITKFNRSLLFQYVKNYCDSIKESVRLINSTESQLMKIYALSNLVVPMLNISKEQNFSEIMIDVLEKLFLFNVKKKENQASIANFLLGLCYFRKLEFKKAKECFTQTMKHNKSKILHNYSKVLFSQSKINSSIKKRNMLIL